MTSRALSGARSRRCEETLLIAFGLVALIIFLFLRDWRSTIIPVIAIPVSIISGFFIMYVAGFSINVLTLVAIVLAIGLVCDDAIVVLENIYAKIEDGMTPLEAALKGSREIYFAVISTTIALAAVFLPLDLPVRSDRAAVPRVRHHAGGLRAGLRLRGAHALADDVPVPAERARREAELLLSGHRAVLPDDHRAATARALAPFLRWRWLAIPILLGNGGLIAWLVTRDPARTRAARGPREHPHQRHRARGSSLRIHRELDGQDLGLRGRKRARAFPLVQHPRRRWRPLGGQRARSRTSI